MSFSRDVKLEIMEHTSMIKHYRTQILGGMLNFSSAYGEKEILLRTQFSEVAEYFHNLIVTEIQPSIQVKTASSGKNDRVWVVRKKDREEILAHYQKQQPLLHSRENLYAYLAGAYLASGNISDPEKSYHFEIVSPREEVGQELFAQLSPLLSSFKTTTRRDQLVLYSKDCRQIQDALTMMGATRSSLEMIGVEMFKNIRNHANRITNCETANIDKTVEAATMQIEDIRLVLERDGEQTLSPSLLETAKLRLKHPYSSLRELMELSPTPISRSGLNHRLATLSKRAETIRRTDKERACV